MVKGKTRGDINVRISPVAKDNTNISFTSRGIVPFIGELITSAIDGKQWISLIDINGVKATNSFIAAWVVDFDTVLPVVFPETFTLTAPNGETASYKFVEVL